jgi:hypothetical protein
VIGELADAERFGARALGFGCDFGSRKRKPQRWLGILS